VLYPAITTVISNDQLADASAGELLIGTTIVSVPIAIGIVAGGELALGVGTIGGISAGAAEFGIGTHAVVAPGLGSGSYPGLLIGSTVYVARFHEVAWEMAGRAEPVVKYGIAVIDATGKVIGWL
jgi:hypothetical protein